MRKGNLRRLATMEYFVSTGEKHVDSTAQKQRKEQRAFWLGNN